MAKKSLTETAKAILMKESNDATPDRDAKKVTPNAATLRPGSKTKEEPFATPGSTPPNPGEVEDLGPATTSPDDAATGPAVASKSVGKDKSGSSQSRVGSVAGEIRQALSEEDVKVLDEFIAEKFEEGLSEEEVEEAIHETFEFFKEEDNMDNITEEEDVIEEEPVVEVNMQEHVDALLEGEDVSEEFKQKAKTIFEAAINAKLAPEIKRIENVYEERLVEEVQEIENQLEENVTDFVNHVVESWLTENEVAVESGLRNELTEEFIAGLRNLFVENYVDIPEEKVNVVEEMAARVQELEAKLNEQIEIGVEQTKRYNELKKETIVNEASKGLADTQVSKLKELAEGVVFTTESEFSEKLNTLKENYFPSAPVKNDKVLDEVDQSLNGKKIVAESNDKIANYARHLGRKLPN